MSLEETAASHLVRRVPTARASETAGAVRDGLIGMVLDDAQVVCVVNADGRLDGIVEIAALLTSPAARSIGDLARPVPHVAPDTDQEEVASFAIRHELPAVPVAGPDGRLAGIVPPSVLFHILRSEHIEDLHRLAGILRESEHARASLEASPTRRARDRLPWLLVGLAGSMVATWIMSRYEDALQARVAVAFFLPGIVYMADAIGTQTEAVAVRGLSFVHRPLGALLWGELRTGALIGLCLAALVLPAVALAFGDFRLGLAAALSVLSAGVVATSVGLCLPWILSHLGRDPAFGSGPVGTIIQDVLSILVYFAIVGALL